MTAYMLNMTVHSIMYSYYFASIYIKDFDKIISIKKSITIIQMVSTVWFPFVVSFVDTLRNKLIWTDFELHTRIHYAKHLQCVRCSTFRCNSRSFCSTASERSRRTAA